MKIARVLLISLLCCGLSAFALDDPKVAHAKYDELAARVRSGDLTVDWQALRLAAEVGEVEGDYDLRDANQRGTKAFNDGKFEDSLKIANEMLAHNIASGDGHFLAMISLKHLGRQADSDKEHAMLDAFFQSIMKSGDGKSAKTAWFTVNVHEEYLVIRLLLGLNLKSQALSHMDGHDYDVMTVTDDSGKESTLWFNTDTDMQKMADEMKAAEGKK
ncbi:MAG: DUF4919 domain-containing protein [Acidobacteriaceae bacterium]|jgi:hypothetical protein